MQPGKLCQWQKDHSQHSLCAVQLAWLSQRDCCLGQQVDRGAPTSHGSMVTVIQRSRSHTLSPCHSGSVLRSNGSFLYLVTYGGKWIQSSSYIIYKTKKTIIKKDSKLEDCAKLACHEMMYIIHIRCFYPQPRICHFQGLNQCHLSFGSEGLFEAIEGEGIGLASIFVQHPCACRSASFLAPDFPYLTSSG